jgi:hypothetical protein
VKYGLLVRPGSLPAARYLVGFSVLSFTLVWLSCAGFVLLLTPTGSLPSPRWRWWARVAVAGLLVAVVAGAVQPDPLEPQYHGNPLAVPALYRLLVVPGVAGIVVVLLSLPVGALSLVGRFRHARGTERLQLRWLALAAALLLIAVAALVMDDGFTLLNLALGVCVALLPLATGAAILRYRLYDLDYLISRTVVYGLLTAGGIGVYVGVVKLAEWLLREGVGLGGSLLATAVIAVGFAPARDRLQRWVDRRLYGDRRDPVRAMARLGQRLRDAPESGRAEDVLAGVLQGCARRCGCRSPASALRTGWRWRPLANQAPPASRSPWSTRASTSGHCWSGRAQVRTSLGWPTGRSWRS